MIAHPWERDTGYVLITPDGEQIIPRTLKLMGPTITPPNITADKAPGSPAGAEFYKGDGTRMLLDVVFQGPMVFATEAEKALYIAQIGRAAAAATLLQRGEISGGVGKGGTAPGYAEWAPGNRAIDGTLKIVLRQTARPQIDGEEVDWA